MTHYVSVDHGQRASADRLDKARKLGRHSYTYTYTSMYRSSQFGRVLGGHRRYFIGVRSVIVGRNFRPNRVC